MPDETKAEARVPALKESRYTEQDWRGHDHYQCNNCVFDTFDRDAMERHQNVVHSR